jgi:hypothetical protein
LLHHQLPGWLLTLLLCHLQHWLLGQQDCLLHQLVVN